jgi:transposase-like protein
MAKKYRKKTRRSKRNDPSNLEGDVRITPEGQAQLCLPIAEVLAGIHHALEDFAAQAGLLVVKGLLEDEVDRKVGPRYGHNGERTMVRWGTEDGFIVFGGRKIAMQRPRVRKVSESEEVPLETYGLFQSDERVQDDVSRRVLRGVSARNYEGVIDDICIGYGIRRSSVSRHWKAATEKELARLQSRPLDDLDIQALFIDGIHFQGECVIVALGVTSEGQKKILGLWEGSTENSQLCVDLLEDLVERGLPTDRSLLFVLDGSKALRKAVKKVFGNDAVVQRCQVHKERNVLSYLPKEQQANIRRRLRVAWGLTDYAKAKAELEKLVTHLEGISHGAAESLREGLEETLTVHRLDLPPSLRKSLRSTNIIESAFSKTRTVCQNVKRWRPGIMRLRWAGTVLLEAEKQFRRIKGFRQLEFLVTALRSRKIGKEVAA